MKSFLYYAVQHLKTASWLALHSRNQAACRRILTSLTELTPTDPWIEKAQQDLKEIDDREIDRCQICGRGAEEVGHATTAAVVRAIVLIIGADLLVTALFYLRS